MTDSILRSVQYYSTTTTIPFPSPEGLLIDTYPATGAYSFRKLSNSYAGSAVRIRRASDDAEADIGFDVDGEFDTAAAAAHINGAGASTGAIHVWYDQSGNSLDLTQATATFQPPYSASALNGGPALLLDNAPHGFSGQHQIGNFYTASNGLAILVIQPTTFANAPNMVADSGGSYQAIKFNTSTGAINVFNYDGTNDAVDTSNVVSDGIDYIIYWAHVGGTLYGRLDNGTEASVASGDTQLLTVTLTIGLNANYYVTEVVFWNDQAVNRTAIQTAVNDHHGIY